MSEKQNFGFIGGGRVANLLLTALKNKKVLPETVIVADPNEGARAKIEAISPERIQVVTDNQQAAQTDVVFLAVHPLRSKT
ncbi:MAG TPA: hypothetical protein ENN22_07635 [bacterium]|nr:hypothetical protein [bacterium]